MTRFAFGRKGTCALVLWSAYLLTWAAASGASPASVVMWWLAGLALLEMFTLSLGRKPDSQARPALLTPAPARAEGAAVWHAMDAVEDWESEGGATATS